jgi:tetratricopeptide (TPR) repeat protein
MVNNKKTLAKRAGKYWEDRSLEALVQLRDEPGAKKDPEVLYFVALALNARNKKREAIEYWRKAQDLNPQYEDAIRALAYELTEQAPVESAEFFYRLVGLQRANADDFTSLGEIRIKQDRLGEARRWLDHALKLDPNNSLALLAMATLYAQVQDRSLTLDYLERTAKTEDIDLADLAYDPQFEFLWHDPKFEKIVSSNGRNNP